MFNNFADSGALLDLSAIDVSRWIIHSVVWPFWCISSVLVVPNVGSNAPKWTSKKQTKSGGKKSGPSRKGKYPNIDPVCYSRLLWVTRVQTGSFFFFLMFTGKSTAGGAAANKQSKNSYDPQPFRSVSANCVTQRSNNCDLSNWSWLTNLK